MPRYSLITLAVIPLVACVSESTFVRQTQLDVFDQVPSDEVDILFVVDDSNSMEEEQRALADGIEGFVQTLEDANSKFHLGMVSTSADASDPDAGRLLGEPAVLDVDDDYVTAFRSRARVGTQGSDKEQGLWAAELALSPSMLAYTNAGFLRDDAVLLVVFVTDEEDCSSGGALDGQSSSACYSPHSQLTPVSHFAAAFAAAKGGDLDLVRIGAIIGLPNGDCATSYPGDRYLELAALTQGVVGNICSSDWSGILHDLGLQAVSLREVFSLTHDAVPESIVVQIDGDDIPEGPSDGWTHDFDTSTIRFHGAAIPPRGSTVTVDYEILTGL